VVGAGAVGLAVARALAMAGREVLVVESASSFGTGTSSRNSEVIHAGIYYPPRSLKVRPIHAKDSKFLAGLCLSRMQTDAEGFPISKKKLAVAAALFQKETWHCRVGTCA
jgi:flavin-dependent dehydrogenase